nr:hypothetical protein [Sphingomonas sp. CDS-1]
MSEHHRFIQLLRMPNGDRSLLLLTFGLTVLIDLTVAIGVGVTLASLLFMMRMSRTVEIANDSGNIALSFEENGGISISAMRFPQASNYSVSTDRSSLASPTNCSTSSGRSGDRQRSSFFECGCPCSMPAE